MEMYTAENKGYRNFPLNLYILPVILFLYCLEQALGKEKLEIYG